MIDYVKILNTYIDILNEPASVMNKIAERDGRGGLEPIVPALKSSKSEIMNEEIYSIALPILEAARIVAVRYADAIKSQPRSRSSIDLAAKDWKEARGNLILSIDKLNIKLVNSIIR